MEAMGTNLGATDTNPEAMETDTPIGSPTSSLFDDSDSSSDIDAEVLESTAASKKKKRDAKDKEYQETKQISKIVKSTRIPHQASALATSVTQFIKHMMGLENSNSTLPEPPAKKEIVQWTNYTEDRKSIVIKKLKDNGELGRLGNDTETSSIENKKKPSATDKFMRKEKLAAVRKDGIELVRYTPAIEIPPQARKQTISFQTKQTVDHEFQSKGFSRITFEWTARSLSASQWNAATATILVENWSRWYKTQVEDQKDLKENIMGIVERWFRNMRTSYLKQLRSVNDSPGESTSAQRTTTKKEVPAKSLKDRKKISEHRHQAACRLFPKNPKFTVLMKNYQTGSDYEDNDNDPTQQRTRIIPHWRSEVFTDVLHQLDEAAKYFQKNAKGRRNLAELLRRGGAKVESTDAEEEIEVPKKLPIDCYNPDYLEKLAALGTRELKAKDPMPSKN
ncbi:hypothetical protein PTTG_29288 [Puccinia triticina 1-1 BBBD Race 1]|uniref:Uncharacterized protein n=1 Tax=Puccinia triticina (isolate 1-1 / race 1 (BBBD)) TaxID=630390 RepID=A0A180G559_PUCT1|nr:hypothetical protein PTTG_29288 [Puccinia triticina 1-1 BBBD Race 1]